MRFRVVQPFGRRFEEWTVQSEHATVEAAFAAIDALAKQMAATGAPSDTIDLIVIDDDGNRVQRSAAQ